MPARPPLSPWGIPIRLAWLGRFPKGEIHWVFLTLSDTNAGAGLQVLQRLMGELSILTELQGAEINVAVFRRISVALFHQIRDNFYNLFHGLGGSRMNGGLPDIQASGVGFIFLDIPLGDGQIIGLLLVSLADNLIVDIGEILHKGYFHAPVFQVSAKNVKHAHGPGVSDMDKIINCGPAGVNFCFSRRNGDKFFLLSGKGIKNFHKSTSRS